MTRSLFALFIIAAIAGFFYLVLEPKNITPDLNNEFAVDVNKLGQSSQGDWKEYRNERYRFSLLYPPELSVVEHPGAGNSSIIIFENLEKGLGFQIFIVPYEEAQVSQERFLMDVPSGVRLNPTPVVIDGITGEAFNSQDPRIGDTGEIWFIRGGYLFEIMTLKPLSSWLGDIMDTWRFL